MTTFKKILALVLVVCMLCSMLPVVSAAEAEETKAAPAQFMQIAVNGNSRYLSTVGSNAFNVFMYDNTFSGVFGDQHMGGIEFSLNGIRIATNGDMHMLPTPEQWDATPAPSKGSTIFDMETNTITVPMTFTGSPDGTLKYDLVAEPTEKGFALKMILKTNMPENLIGKARFNLEFLPGVYQAKTYQADLNFDGTFDSFGSFPIHAEDALVETERPDLPSQAWYVKDWNEQRGDAQPLPFATGYAFDFAPEDPDANIKITAANGDLLELYDGRNRAQNGWYVLSTLISATDAGQTAIEWIVEPGTDPNWIREPNVSHSQVGYAPDQEKFAVVELDMYDNDYPSSIGLYRINADGSEDLVLAKELGATTSWLRYKYVRFDFTEVNKTGLYCIHYGDQVSEPFPIAKDVYDNIWQTTLSGFLAVQMDHISVRDGYKIWHGASHMDDAYLNPGSTSGAGVGWYEGKSSWFDGMSVGSTPQSVINRGWNPDEPVEGLNKGGWFDAGDFDLQMSRNFSVLSQIVQAAEYCGEMDGYDDLYVKWDDATGGVVEMHRPDGVPDVVQQAIHGSKQILAEYEVLGGAGGTMEVRYLRQYTHLGDPSSDTDGWIYDPTLEEGEVVERDGKVYSGVCDDRYMLFNGFSTSMSSRAPDFAAVAYLAAKYNDVDPSYGEYAVKIFNAAVKIWNDENMGNGNSFGNNVQYYLASYMLKEKGLEYNDYDGKYNFEYFENRLNNGLEAALNAGVTSNMQLLALLPVKDEAFRARVAEKAGNSSVSVNTQPYGVNFTTGAGWGSSTNSYTGSRNIAFLYYNFPEECQKYEQNILRSVNYMMGLHPVTNSSWISGVGAKSALHPYNSNRAEESYIPGSILPGHITFSDFAETMGDFYNFLWFENESIIDYQSNWLPVGIAAGKIAHNDKTEEYVAAKDFESDFDAKLVGSGNNRYFADDGFNVFMYNTTFSGVFGDQHNGAIELVQDGRRIATNGDIRLLPTPEQWDSSQPAAKRGTRTFAEDNITVNMTLPAETFTDGTPDNPAVNYQLIAEPEDGGIKLTVKLDAPLPEDLVGKAGFNMEFLPAVFMEKSFMADSDGDGKYDDFGVFPRDPRSDMADVERARTNNQYWYVQEWNEMRGNAQPLPFATGTKMTFAAEDDDYRIRIECEDGLGLYDGRNRAQNGWYVVRTLIPADATEVVWHISPDTSDSWTREPNISHSQVGYEPALEKIATIELDPNYEGSNYATLKKLNADGTYSTVISRELTDYVNSSGSKVWKRYVYKYFDFSDIQERGTYVIDYDGYVSDPFPIDAGVYSDIWQRTLSTYLGIQMDHMRIREGYKIWRNAAHMDDALQAPKNTSFFDGWSMGNTINSGYDEYEHIPGLDVGGFCDAGDFDIQTGSNLTVISTLALAYQIYGKDYDTLAIDWDTRNVELHRPDGDPDLVQLAKHGALQILGQLDATAAKNDGDGFLASVIEVPTLRQYTHLGDGAKDTDGFIYDASLAEDEVYGRRAGKRDDRLAFFSTKNAGTNRTAAAALAATADILKGIDDETAARCLEWAEKIWATDGNNDWNLALNLYKATGKDEYKDVVLASFDSNISSSRMKSNGYKLVLVLDQLGDEYKEKFETALKACASSINTNGYNANNPYHVSDSGSGWGGTEGVVNSASVVSILHKYYPDIIGTDPIYRAINYILGNHPDNSTSFVSSVGYDSVDMGYGSNRADNYYISGGMVPGYCTLSPDLPEFMNDFNFLWFEHEYTVVSAVDWILASIAADDFARDMEPECKHSYAAKVKAPGCTTEGYTTYICSKCFDSYVGAYTDPVGHDWDDGVITKAPLAVFEGEATFTCQRCGLQRIDPVAPLGGEIDMSDIDFTDADNNDRFAVDYGEAAITDGKGLHLASTTASFETSGGDFAPNNVIKIPVTGDWTATLKYTGAIASSAFSWGDPTDILGFYVMDNFQNGVGIRADNKNFKSFTRTNGTVKTAAGPATGLGVQAQQWLRIEKTGDDFVCYNSLDGEEFTELFSFTDTGLEGKMLVLDAYNTSAWSFGGTNSYDIESLEFGTEGGDEPAGNFMEIAVNGSNRYLSTVGSNAFNVFMYDNTFSGTFGDQHMGGIELALNGIRIATNGDLHMLPTPEQWDATPAPSRGTKVYDMETNTITVPMTFSGSPDGTLKYDLIAEPTEKGFALKMVLRSAMPEDLIGKARFNLEFLPGVYQAKSYQADLNFDGEYDSFGSFPIHAQDEMVETERPNLPSQTWYVKDWNEQRGDSQPLPFATGYAFNFAPEDENANISITAANGDLLELYDGRNRAQNGWYVVSTLITATKAGETAIEWVIEPGTDPKWVREPNVGFSQVGYSPKQEKFAVVELDMWDTKYPRDISLWRVNADGSETKVCEKQMPEPEELTSYLRYKYARFNFTEVEEVGLYRIHYGDQVNEVFPIAQDVYDNIWQTTLSGFLAVQMDHITVREGYKIWHGASHMDDAFLNPGNTSGTGVGWYAGKSGYFDGMSVGKTPQSVIDRGWEPDQHVEGLNKGGWFDAGDFDLQMSRNFSVLSQIVQAAEFCGQMDGYDDLYVEWNDATGGLVEMHRPDGVPDVVQQAIHGSKQILAEYEVLGGAGGTMEVRYLRQYTHLGDPSSDTDGWIYDPTLDEGEVVERDGKVYSGVCDDRYMLFNGFSTTMSGRAADFAATAYLSAQYNDVDASYGEYAVQIMNAANKIWKDEKLGNSSDFNRDVQYTLATYMLEKLGLDYEDYDGTQNYAYFRARMDAGLDSAISKGINSNLCLLALLPVIDEDPTFLADAEGFKAKLEASVDAYAGTVAVKDTPYGISWFSGAGWGGSPNSYSSQRNAAFMYYNFPNAKLENYILTSVDYLLGRHPATNSSWISGVGTKSSLHPYNSNRAEESYIPGSILPGHITFSDFEESMGDFYNFLWFENESIINYQSSWLPVGIAAGKIAHNEEATEPAETIDFESSYDAKLVSVNSGRDGYFSDDGFDIFMYSTTFSGVFGDQHSAAVELVQNGRRIATNGDIRLLPTPEQWDSSQPANKRNSRTFEEDKITVDMTLPEETFTDGTPTNPAVEYQIIAEPEKGGIKLTLKLDEPLPADLVGYAGFNMEFLPAVFMEKSYMADSDGDGVYDDFGVFPRDPRSQMEDVHRARTNNQYWYVQEWNEMRGDAQPLPFAEGYKMTFAAEDDDYRIRIECEDGFGLYDGRNRAQNGWYVLRTLIPADKTEIVWHISPDTNDGWTREPNISHSQVGYEPELEKVATIELDPNYKGSNVATLKKLNSDGTYTDVLTKELTAYANEDGSLKLWQRYNYKYFDFTEVKARGTYVIDYDGFVSDPFPIDAGVYSDIWQRSLSTYLAIQMDHMKIREGYKIWRNAAHMDDALQVPMGVAYFDGQSSARATYVDEETQMCASGYQAYEHIPGLDVGGYCDAGDFDIQLGSNLGVISDLALAYQVYGKDYDTLAIDWDTRNVELHRPDGDPDLVQLAKHGALQILGQLEATAARLGDENAFLASVIEVPTLRQYTHLGDGAKDTDGYIYDASLAEDEVYGRKSGLRDDRLAFFTTKSASSNRSAASALAATADVLKGIDDETAARCIKWAEQIWAVDGANDFGVALNLFKATGKDEYKQVLIDQFDTQIGGSNFTRNGYKLVLVLDQFDDEYKAKFEEALKANAASINNNGYNANNPYHVANSSAGWGGASGVAGSANIVSILHKYYPDIIGTEPIYRAINYVLGNHPYNSTSYVSSVGYKSVTQGYGSNRADNYYISGGLAPGYCTLAPDLPEHMDDFNFLWFENEYTVGQATSWILASIAADDYARDAEPECEHDYKALVSEPTCTKDGFTTYICNKCFDKYDGDIIPALGHDYEVVSVLEPTCTKGGNSTFVCARCGDTYVGAETEALGHEFVDGTCVRCGRPENVAFKQATTIEAGKQYVIVDQNGLALVNKGTIGAAEVAISEGVITSEVSDDMIWDFSQGVSTHTNGEDGFFLTVGDSGILARGSGTTLNTTAYVDIDALGASKDYYAYWMVKDFGDGTYGLYAGNVTGGSTTKIYTPQYNASSKIFEAHNENKSALDSMLANNPLRLFEIVDKRDVTDILIDAAVKAAQEAQAAAEAAQAAAEEAKAAAEEAAANAADDMAAAEAAKAAAEAAQKAAEDAKKAADDAAAAAKASDEDAAKKAADAAASAAASAASAADAAKAQAAAQAAQAAAEAAKKAADEAAASAAADKAASEAAKKAAEAAQKAAEDAKKAAEAADADAAAKAADAAKAQAAAAEAQAAAQAAQAAAEAAAADAGAEKAAAEAAKKAAEAAKAAAEKAQAAAEAANAEAAENAANAAKAQAAAAQAQAAAQAAQKAAEDAAADAAADKTAADAAKAAAELAQSRAEVAQKAAEAAQKAAEAAEAEAAANAAKTAADAANAAEDAAEAAKAQAAAQVAQSRAEAAQKAAEAAQAKADAAAAKGEDAAEEAIAAQKAADDAKKAAQDAKDAAALSAAAAKESNSGAAAAAAQAAADAAKVAEALEKVAAAEARMADEAAKAEASEKAAAAAELGAAKYYALTKLALAANAVGAGNDDIQASIDAIEGAKDVAGVDAALAAALKALDDFDFSCPSADYIDAPAKGNWAHEGIDYCIDKGYMNGTSEFVFSPAGTVTRAQLVTILYRVDGEKAVTTSGTFCDVPAGQWYSDAIEWAAANGVVNGVGEGKFNPMGAITREQIAAILYRYSKAAAPAGDLKAFPDAADASTYAVDALVWATAEGLITGVKSGDVTKLAPKDNATRAQIAAIIMRFLDGSYNCK